MVPGKHNSAGSVTAGDYSLPIKGGMKMKCVRAFALVSVLIVSLMAAGSTAPVAAGPSEHLNWGSPLTSGADACPTGNLVINVKQRVLNDFDSGVAGNNWAFDDFVRSIQVIELYPGTYCATVKYQGQFTTIAGISPGGSDTVGEGVIGTFEGGYVSAVFTATLSSSPSQRTMGSIGTVDYQCNVDASCPGYADWTTFYFTGVSGFDLAWWGWVYHAGNNGSWVNSIDGNTGDITGN